MRQGEVMRDDRVAALPSPGPTSSERLLRVTSSCVSEEEFTAWYGRFATEDSIVLPLRPARLAGEAVHVEVLLKDRPAPLLRGRAVIREHAAGEPVSASRDQHHVCLQFIELDESSRARLAHMSATGLAGPPTQVWSCSVRRLGGLPLQPIELEATDIWTRPPPAPKRTKTKSASPPPIPRWSPPLLECDEETTVRQDAPPRPDAAPSVDDAGDSAPTRLRVRPFEPRAAILQPSPPPPAPPPPPPPLPLRLPLPSPVTAELPRFVEPQSWFTTIGTCASPSVRPSKRALFAAWCGAVVTGLALVCGLSSLVESRSVRDADAREDMPSAADRSPAAQVPADPIATPLVDEPACSATITSRPSGAQVSWNQRALGKTPVAGADVPCGDAVVSWQHPRYTGVEQRVSVTPGTTIELSRRLVRSRRWLRLRSLPAGAEFRVDGELIGKTDARVRVHTYSTVSVSASKRGFRPKHFNLEMADTSRTITVRLEPYERAHDVPAEARRAWPLARR